MEDKIEVGEYVRTKNGIITKCEDFYDNFYYFDKTVERRYEESFESFYIDDINKKIVNHSKNIIDLIEVGDYVNGYKILDINEISNKNKRVFTIFKNGKSEFANI